MLVYAPGYSVRKSPITSFLLQDSCRRRNIYEKSHREIKNPNLQTDAQGKKDPTTLVRECPIPSSIISRGMNSHASYPRSWFLRCDSAAVPPIFTEGRKSIKYWEGMRHPKHAKKGSMNFWRPSPMPFRCQDSHNLKYNGTLLSRSRAAERTLRCRMHFVWCVLGGSYQLDLTGSPLLVDAR